MGKGVNDMGKNVTLIRLTVKHFMQMQSKAVTR